MTQPQIDPPNNSLALASLILGLLVPPIGFLFALSGWITPLAIILMLLVGGFFGALAIIFGFIGISTANRLQGKRRAQAIWGVVLGFSLVPGYAIGLIMFTSLGLTMNT